MLRVPELTSELAKYGFELTNNIDRCRYKGALRCHGLNVPVYLDITDPDLIKLPEIYLLERPLKLSSTCSHLGSDNKLCYAQENLAFIDRYQPIKSIIRCIELANAILEKLVAGDPVQDTQDEFGAYWGGAPVLIDISDTNQTGSVKAWEAKIRYWDKPDHIWITNLDSSKDKYNLSNTDVDRKYALLYIIEAIESPKVSTKTWPIKSLYEFIHWCREYDTFVYKDFLNSLKECKKYKTNSINLLVKHPASWYALTFSIPPIRKYKHINDFVHAIINKYSKSIKIKRIQPYRIDNEYIVDRNLPSSIHSLKDRKIALIGCGTIGSYLSETIVKLGAGYGDGILHLIDNDILLPGNLGRHNLGFKDLFKSKAPAIEEFIKNKYPGANIHSHKIEGQYFSQLTDMDIILDATASGGFSSWLNEQFLNHDSFPPIIFSWIAGNGLASQAFLLCNKNDACYRCLRLGDITSEYYPIKKEPQLEISNAGGCESSYVPFSSMAALHASSLASQLLLNWNNSDTKQTLKTISLDNKNTKTLPKKNPNKWKFCPACNN